MTLGVVLSSTVPYLGDRAPLNLARLAAQWSPGILMSYFPSTDITDTLLDTAFYMSVKD